MIGTVLPGLKVVEFCRLISGPYCTKLLADLGAEVVKIEEPGRGDPARRRSPFPDDTPHPERSGLFLYLNTNKLSITLNVRTATGKKLFGELVKQTDILVEDNSPTELEALELDYRRLRTLNPQLIMTSITPFGQTGPYKDHKAYYLNIFQSGGEGYLTPPGSSYLDRGPLKGAGYVADYDAGLSAAVATLAALYARKASGSGQHVDVSKQETEMTLERVEVVLYPNDGVVPTRATSKTTAGAVTPCRDGHVVMVVGEDHQWQSLVKLMGSPVWTKEDRFRDRSARWHHAEEMYSLISEWTKNYTKDEVFRMAQAANVPAGPVFSSADIVNSRQSKARGFIVELDHSSVGKLKYPNMPYRFSKAPCSGGRAAPLLGEHNEEVFGNRLGYSRQQIVKMMETGVI